MCEMTSGRNTTCDAPGGVKRAILYSLKDSLGVSNYATPPTIVDGECTAIALKPTKLAYAFNVEQETMKSTATSVGETTKGSIAYEHNTTIVLMGNTKEDCAMAAKIIRDRVGVIVELNDGSYELYHYEPGRGGKVQRTRDTGTLLDDMNGSTLTIASRQVGGEVKISSVLVEALLAG